MLRDTKRREEVFEESWACVQKGLEQGTVGIGIGAELLAGRVNRAVEKDRGLIVQWMGHRYGRTDPAEAVVT
jgi:hypothetical protein